MIQPDGTITLRLLGQIMAAGLTIDDLRKNLETLYEQYYKEPTITVAPIRVNTKLEDLRSTVDNRNGFGGQDFTTNVSPDGTVQLPAVGSVPAQGLTLDELKAEVDERYASIVDGIEATPISFSCQRTRFVAQLMPLINCFFRLTKPFRSWPV